MALKKAHTVEKADQEKAVANKVAETAMELNDEVLGSRVGDLTVLKFVRDNTRGGQKVSRKGEDGNLVSIIRYPVIGYVVRANVDIQIPDYGKLTSRKDLMAQEEYTPARDTAVTLKAGETAVLSLLETFTLLDRPEYANIVELDPSVGEVNGKPVRLHEHVAGRHSDIQTNKLPTATLQFRASNTALFQANENLYEDAFVGGAQAAPFQPKAGFEKFGALVYRESPKRKEATGSAKRSLRDAYLSTAFVSLRQALGR